MSFQKFMRNLFKGTEGTETSRSNKPETTPEQPRTKEGPEQVPFILDAVIQGTPWFVNLMQGFYSSNKSIVPPECWKLPDGVKCTKDLDLENDYHQEIWIAFKYAQRKITDMYFQFLREIEVNRKSGGDPGKVSMNISFTIHVLQPFVKYEVLESGAFYPTTIPAIEVGGEYYLRKNMMGQFKNLVEVVENIPELQEWKESLLLMEKLHKEVKKKIKQEPGIQQKDIKKLFGEGNEGTVQKAIYILEKQGKVERKKKGSTYELFLTE